MIHHLPRLNRALVQWDQVALSLGQTVGHRRAKLFLRAIQML